MRRRNEINQKWALGEVQGEQNVPHSAWVKTDAASKTANATSGETRLLATSVFTYALRDIFCTSCTPQVSTYALITEFTMKMSQKMAWNPLGL
jgi:hypothetical protein